MTCPKEVTNSTRKKLYPIYNRAGALESIKLDDTEYVKHIAYNAKGQRILIVYGNNIMTRYAYDQKTFRLSRMRSEVYNFNIDNNLGRITFSSTGTQSNTFQDFAYDYDHVGNILSIHDCTPGSGITNNPDSKDELDRIFNYDPLYRLVSATGRDTNMIL